MTTPTIDHWPRLVRMRGNAYFGLQLVRIIEGLDKRSPDNRGCTVVAMGIGPQRKPTYGPGTRLDASSYKKLKLIPAMCILISIVT